MNNINFDDELAALLSGLTGITPEPEPEPDTATAPAPEPEAETVITTPAQKVEKATDEVNDALANLLGSIPDTVEEPTEQEPSPEPEEVPEPEPAVTTTSIVTQVCETPEFTSDELMDTIDIRNFATLVTLSTARWHAKVKDRKAAKAAADATGATSNAFAATKNLLAGCDEKLKRIHTAIDNARTQHYAMTLPWSVVGVNDRGKRAGARLLPNTLFMEYTTAMAQAKQEMEEALAAFIPEYPNLINAARKMLSGSFVEREYPDPKQIEEHFDLSFDFAPIPRGCDFQGLQDAQVNKLKDTLDKRTRTMLENAMQDVWKRLRELVGHAAEKLGDPNATFHYTMVDKLRESVDMMDHLNITNDDRIVEIRDMISGANGLTMHDPKAIRKDDALKAQLGKRASEIVARMDEITAAGL